MVFKREIVFEFPKILNPIYVVKVKIMTADEHVTRRQSNQQLETLENLTYLHLCLN